ncbi:hypothetical protein PIB30_107574, partial [Stylosanthes scabra]|nr:hypothetical protein [Stylosanthes scabra]
MNSFVDLFFLLPTVLRAMLIHSIIIGENINVEEIIAEQIYKFIYKTDISSSLPFPSIIAALCTDDSPKTFSFLYKRATPASEPDQVVSLYEWISFPRR